MVSSSCCWSSEIFLGEVSCFSKTLPHPCTCILGLEIHIQLAWALAMCIATWALSKSAFFSSHLQTLVLSSFARQMWRKSPGKLVSATASNTCLNGRLRWPFTAHSRSHEGLLSHLSFKMSFASSTVSIKMAQALDMVARTFSKLYDVFWIPSCPNVVDRGGSQRNSLSIFSYCFVWKRAQCWGLKIVMAATVVCK